MSRELARYTAQDGSEIVLSDSTIRKYICDNDAVTDKEIMLFAALCKSQNLNPFTREAYLIKYGDRPATMVTGKDVFTKRAAANPKFKGYEAGITVITQDGRLIRRDGSMPLPTEQMMGGWCKVYVEGYEKPMFDEVAFSEYSTGRANWQKMPGTMIRKVAIVHSLREAFPSDFQGLYESCEMGVDEPEDKPIEAVPVEAEEAEPWPEPIVTPDMFEEVFEEEF